MKTGLLWTVLLLAGCQVTPGTKKIAIVGAKLIDGKGGAPLEHSILLIEGSTLVKGSMLEHSLDAILDFAGERKAAFRLIFCEVQSHAAYGTSPDLFNVFFEVIADVVRDLIGDAWTADVAAAWRGLLDELDRYVKDAVQAANIA